MPSDEFFEGINGYISQIQRFPLFKVNEPNYNCNALAAFLSTKEALKTASFRQVAVGNNVFFNIHFKTKTVNKINKIQLLEERFFREKYNLLRLKN